MLRAGDIVFPLEAHQVVCENIHISNIQWGRLYLEVYIYVHIYVSYNNEKRGHDFELEQRGICEGPWRDGKREML